jgi:hypothetical protein
VLLELERSSASNGRLLWKVRPVVRFIVNPGTGPVQAHSLEHAEANMTAFAADLGGGSFSSFGKEEEGRYLFTLHYEGRRVEIWMPGCPLESVRYTGEPDQNIWDFPRLYVNGNSWVWKFALNSARGE